MRFFSLGIQGNVSIFASGINRQVMIFEKIFENTKPFAGCLLVSEPFMIDPNFRRTVILITEHNDKGTVGFVVNKELTVFPHKAISSFPEFGRKLLLGGPVQRDNLFFIHTIGKKIEGASKVAPGLWWGGDYDQIKELVKSGKANEDNVRFIVGYSGWEPGQLDQELSTNSWIITKASKEYVFGSEPEALWKKVLRDMGKDFAVVADLPEDPTLN